MLVKMSIDPFEIATNEYDTPPDSPLDIEATTEAGNEEDILKEDIKTNNKGGTSATATPINSDGEDDEEVSQPPLLPNATAAEEPPKSKDEEEENMDVELSKYQSGDPDKIDKFTTVLAQLTPDQMNRYESFRRSGFQKANMRRVLQSIAGCPISHPMTIVMSGIAKMFVGELVEMGRMVMTERNESGPIRPCHIREAYRRLKLEGKGENPKKTGAPNAVCLYSIASTKYGDSFDGKTTLCVRRAIYYDTVSGKDPSKNGICSNYLCDGKPGDKVQITGRDPMNSEL